MTKLFPILHESKHWRRLFRHPFRSRRSEKPSEEKTKLYRFERHTNTYQAFKVPYITGLSSLDASVNSWRPHSKAVQEIVVWRFKDECHLCISQNGCHAVKSKHSQHVMWKFQAEGQLKSPLKYMHSVFVRHEMDRNVPTALAWAT